MSCIHIASCQLACSPSAFPAKAFKLNTSPSPAYLGTRLRKIFLKSTRATTNSSSSSSYLGTRLPEISMKTIRATSNHQKSAVVCLFGGKGESENDNQSSPWNALENAMGYFRKDRSVEDVLKQQIQKQEYYDGVDDGGDDGVDDGGDDGGGVKRRGGGGDGFGEGEDKGFSGVWEEFVQVFLATMALIFTYIYIIEGEMVTALAKDFLRFVFTRQKSIRLKRFLDQWKAFFEAIREKRVIDDDDDPDWLGRVIVETPTWFDHPYKIECVREALKADMEKNSSNNNNNDNNNDNNDIDDDDDNDEDDNDIAYKSQASWGKPG